MDQYFPDKELVFGVVSGRASTAINRRLYRSFRANDIPLTPEQWMVLQYLSYKDGISQQELAKITFKDKPGITRMLQILERESLITRLADNLDKRSNLISITKAGLAVHQRARIHVLQTMQTALRGFSEEEIRIGEKILKKIFGNLE
jgi:MarR family transcriptional regulator, organic hydroperoxide resistance regulator